RRRGDLRDARLEVNRRHHVRELHGLELDGGDVANLDVVSGLVAEHGRIARPWRELLIAGQLPLDGLPARTVVEQLRLGARGEQRSAEQPKAPLTHGCPLPLARAARMRRAHGLAARTPRFRRTGRTRPLAPSRHPGLASARLLALAPT